MKRYLPWVLGLLIYPSVANGVDLGSALLPSPISIALTVGKWLMNDERKTYFIQVEATAENRESARNEAFRLAVEMAVGALVVSETEVKNNELIRREIVKYSSGYIDNFAVASETKVGDRTRLVVDVWVGESKIAERLLNVSKGDGSIDGGRIAVQSETLSAERENAAKLLELVAKDYPKRAFNIKVGKSLSTFSNQQIFIEIPITMNWNSKYLMSLIDVLEQTKDGTERRLPESKGYKFIVSYKKSAYSATAFAAHRTVRITQIFVDNFLDSRPQLRVSFKDENGHVVTSNCKNLGQLSGHYYGNGRDSIGIDEIDNPNGQFIAERTPYSDFGIFGDYEISGNIKTVFNEKTEIVSRIRNVEVDIVRKDVCDENDESLSSRTDVISWCRTNLGNGKKYCPLETR